MKGATKTRIEVDSKVRERVRCPRGPIVSNLDRHHFYHSAFARTRSLRA